MAEMIAGARTCIDSPDPQPLGGGVLSVARVIDTSGHELMGVAGPHRRLRHGRGVDRVVHDDARSGARCSTTAASSSSATRSSSTPGCRCDLQRLDDGRDPGPSATRLRRVAGPSTTTSTPDWRPTADVVDLGGPFPMRPGHRRRRGLRRDRLRRAADAAHPPPVHAVRLRQRGRCKTNLDGTLSTCAGSLVAPLTTADHAAGDVDRRDDVRHRADHLLRGPVTAISVPQQTLRRRHLRPDPCARRAHLRPRVRLPRGEGRSDLLMTTGASNGQPYELPAGPGSHDAGDQGRRLLRPAYGAGQHGRHRGLRRRSP